MAEKTNVKGKAKTATSVGKDDGVGEKDARREARMTAHLKKNPKKKEG